MFEHQMSAIEGCVRDQVAMLHQPSTHTENNMELSNVHFLELPYACMIGDGTKGTNYFRKPTNFTKFRPDCNLRVVCCPIQPSSRLPASSEAKENLLNPLQSVFGRDAAILNWQ
ncbi:hypothetical protein OUZ56_003680 [Daphnia magna]|uniref:Uncharacterized protein n=1 Tax=Daphnia magna TaxID=35525 RepID=A0ABR0A9F7_9CRUS|nr:hypothetical protein OUZ56_003680 [Daphnia magna]